VGMASLNPERKVATCRKKALKGDQRRKNGGEKCVTKSGPRREKGRGQQEKKRGGREEYGVNMRKGRETEGPVYETQSEF